MVPLYSLGAEFQLVEHGTWNRAENTIINDDDRQSWDHNFIYSWKIRPLPSQPCISSPCLCLCLLAPRIYFEEGDISSPTILSLYISIPEIGPLAQKVTIRSAQEAYRLKLGTEASQQWIPFPFRKGTGEIAFMFSESLSCGPLAASWIEVLRTRKRK